jgi:putative methionine-R-sulfoxide reductase with GAF domain
MKEVAMTEIEQKSTNEVEDRQKRIGLWAAGISAFLGLAFFIFSLYNVLILQKGEADFSDWSLTPVTILMFLAGLAGFLLIRRNHVTLGLWLVYGVVLIPPIMVVLLLENMHIIAIAYLAVFAPIWIAYVFPKASRRAAIIVSVAALLVIIGIEVWHPAYRLGSTALGGFAPFAIAIGALGLLVFSISQTWGRSMRNKLLVSFIGVTLVTAGTLAVYVYISTNNIIQKNLERELTQQTAEVAVSIGNLLDEQVNTAKALALNNVLEKTVIDKNNTYLGDASAIQAEIDNRDTQWRAADKAGNDTDPLVHEYLTNQAALELKKFQKSFPNNIEIFITDVYGGLAGTTDRTSDYNQADEGWWQAAYNNGKGAVYISDHEVDVGAGASAVLIALPIRNNETGKLIGIFRTTYLASGLNPILSEKVGNTGKFDLFFPGEVVSHYNEGLYTQVKPELFNEIQKVTAQGMAKMDYEGTPSVILQSPVQTLKGNPAVNKLGWLVVYRQNQDEALAPAQVQVRGAIIVMAIVLALAVAAAFGLSSFLVGPIVQLTQTAEEVAAGNLNSRAAVTGSDEIGTLASTFNSMTSQLQETLVGLEQRVAARTQDLATVAEVGTATATILDTDKLLQAVVDLTKKRFNLYHSHIYLLDEAGENLVLASGAGEPGRQMVAEGRSIPLSREQSLVARAARERKGVTVNDVTQAPDFLPNPLLPETRSELAVPMVVGEKVIGVFDIQSDVVGRFTESDVNIQTTLAAQVATSIQNVRSFEQSKSQADLESLVNAIGQKIQRATTVEDTLQTAIREVGLALGAARVSANIGTSRQYVGDKVSRN